MWLRINKIHKKYEIAYHNYAEAESARIKCKNSLCKPAHDQNSNIQRYFHIFMAQKSSKSG